MNDVAHRSLYEALARRIYRLSADIEKPQSRARMAFVQFSIPRAENAATDEAAK